MKNKLHEKKKTEKINFPHVNENTVLGVAVPYSDKSLQLAESGRRKN